MLCLYYNVSASSVCLKWRSLLLLCPWSLTFHMLSRSFLYSQTAKLHTSSPALPSGWKLKTMPRKMLFLRKDSKYELFKVWHQQNKFCKVHGLLFGIRSLTCGPVASLLTTLSTCIYKLLVSPSTFGKVARRPQGTKSSQLLSVLYESQCCA